MYLNQLRRAVVAVLVVAVFAVPSYAAKRRSVGHSSPANLITADINGVVLDNVTGRPVIGARVTANDVTRVTDNDGRFSLRGVRGSGSIPVLASRSGYNAGTQSVTTSGPHEITIRVDPLPTVLVRRTDGSTVNIDSETVEFGYPVTFLGYFSAPFEDLCTTSGQIVELDRSSIKRINGPGVLTSFAACCKTETMRLNITLRDGSTADYYVIDICNGNPNVYVIGREHATNAAIQISYADIAEVVFP